MIRSVSALLGSCALSMALVACSSSQMPKGPPRAVIDRALKSAPGAAQPSTIVAAELAFARAARERGQWTAFRQFAAPGALVHGPDGPLAVDAWLAGKADPAAAVQRQPRVVAVSCDGALAVGKGRYRDPQGRVGSFVTVWERQPSGDYRYIFDASGDDVPQPPPPPQQQVEEGDIVVTEMDAVTGLVASCPRKDTTVPAPPAIPIGEDGKADARLSRDGTLRWRWEQSANGTRSIVADYFYEGRWLNAIEQSLVLTGE
ncbi:hypothetical protein [Erythrobacter sp. R86502]|uniref:hypothetical protein n=1 Tax=Erythrobacter sp. R86502 TaxID=3093846 RepID=UPI0036D21AFB